MPDSEDPDASDVYDLTQKVKQMAENERNLSPNYEKED